MALFNFGDVGDTGKVISQSTGAVSEQMRALPIGQMILHLAEGIADAQASLDLKAIAQFKAMKEAKIDIGDGVERNMLQLGFAPHFYYFQKATFEIKVELKFHVEEAETTKFGVNASFNYGTQASGAKQQGDKAQGDKAQGDKAQGDKTQGNKSEGGTS